MIPIAAGYAAAKLGQGALPVLRQAGKLLIAGQAGGSLTGYASIGNLEPIALIDDSLRRNPEVVSPLANVLQSVITAYFLRAVSLNNVTIGGVSVAKHLEPYNTNRNAVTAVGVGLSALENNDYHDRLVFENEVRLYPKAALEGIADGRDSFAIGCHQFKRQRDGSFARTRSGEVKAFNLKPAMEAIFVPGPGNQLNKQSMGDRIRDKVNQVGGAAWDKAQAAAAEIEAEQNVGGFEYKQVADVVDAGNLVTGKLVNVTLKHGKESAVVPVSVRLNCQWVATDALAAVVGGAKDIRMGTRWKQMLNGEISWKDMVTSQDLMEEHKRLLREDKSGIYLAMLKRRQNNANAAIASGMPSMNTASSVFIVSSETASKIELRAGGFLSDFQFRQRIFQHGYSMIMAVVNTRMGSVTIYTRDLPEYTELDFSELKSSSKKDGPDIGDILSAFRAGNSMRL